MERLNAVLAYDPGPTGAALILLLITAATGYGIWRWWLSSRTRRNIETTEIIEATTPGHLYRAAVDSHETELERERRPWRGTRSAGVELGRPFGDDDARAILGRLPR